MNGEKIENRKRWVTISHYWRFGAYRWWENSSKRMLNNFAIVQRINFKVCSLRNRERLLILSKLCSCWLPKLPTESHKSNHWSQCFISHCTWRWWFLSQHCLATVTNLLLRVFSWPLCCFLDQANKSHSIFGNRRDFCLPEVLSIS